jgi:hypothetical protein
VPRYNATLACVKTLDKLKFSMLPMHFIDDKLKTCMDGSPRITCAVILRNGCRVLFYRVIGIISDR